MADFLTLCATLREALEKLTPGPWLQDSDKPHTVLAVEGGYIGSVLYNVNEHDVPGIVLLRNHVPTLLDGIETLQRELEHERMRLACCGVAAMQNTPASIERHRLPADSPYRSGSYDDVCAAVDREMALQSAIEQREQENARLRAALPDALLKRIHEQMSWALWNRDWLPIIQNEWRELIEEIRKARAALGGGSQ